MKKNCRLIVVFAMIFALLFPSVGMAKQDVKIFIDGKEQMLDVNPVVKNGRTLVPARGIFEKLGADVKWEQKTGKITIEKLGLKIELQIGSDAAVVNGTKEVLDEPAQLVNQRTLIPLRFVVEKLGVKINWNDKNNTISLTSLEKWLMEKLAGVELTSYSAEILQQVAMEMAGEAMEMEMAIEMDVIAEPFQTYTKTSINLLGAEEVSEAYITEDAYYSFEPVLGGWIKYPDEFIGDLIANDMLSSNDPVAQFEAMNKYIDGIAAIETDDYYALKVTISNEGFKEIMGDILPLVVPIAGEDDDLAAALDAITINQFEIISFYNKETLYPEFVEGIIAITIEIEDEKMVIAQVLSGSYSNFNNLTEIVIPEEIIKNATKFEDIDFDSLVE